ncbi:MAG: DUF4145 domain-containing protein [Roseovarius sp.]|uniref:DUF4145 domain-containing protein n=1 Tax=Roseovarius sp. TaxID=1486281 RepID=UPI004059B73E
MHKPPSFGEVRFSCPHCGALAHQYWSTLHAKELGKDKVPIRYDYDKVMMARKEEADKPAEDRRKDWEILDEFIKSASGAVFRSRFRHDPFTYLIYNLEISACDSCREISVWMDGRMIYPTSTPVGIASDDMPDRVKSLFEEAGAVFSTSPRASAALLRLALQHLLIKLGGHGKDMNADINSLIDTGLHPEIAKVMHSLRIIGNESVHPGVISVDDEPYIAEALFDLLNQIVDQLITRPRKRQELWERLPEQKREQVERRLANRQLPQKDDDA